MKTTQEEGHIDMPETSLPTKYFRRQDERDDATFYEVPRKVVHIDDHAIAALSTLYDQLLPPNAHLLDLMSSWRSHYSAGLQPKRVDALGMNGPEMADNPQLSAYVVQNLNQNPSLPYDDNTFDGVTCAVSVQYLINPTQVFAEVNRVLKEDAPFIVSFSNRCFPTKAVAIWLQASDEEHIALVQDYFNLSGSWRDVGVHRTQGKRSLFGGQDPLYAVYGYKSSK